MPDRGQTARNQHAGIRRPWVLAAALAVCVFAASCVSVPPPPVPPPESEAGGPVVPPAPPLEVQAEPVVPPAYEDGGVIPVTRDGALVTALVNNPGLEAARFGPRIAGLGVPEERAAFDPSLMGTLSYGSSKNQLGGVQSFTFDTGGGGAGGGPVATGDPEETAKNVLQLLAQQYQRSQVDRFIDANNTQAAAELSNDFPTGTTVFLTGGMERRESNFFPEEYEGRWTLGVTQALLEGRRLEVNLVGLRQARNRVSESKYRLLEATLDLVERVELAYWDLLLAQEVLAIREFGVELAEEQLDLTKDLLTAGRAVRGDVMSAEAERATREADLYDARANLRQRGIALMQLINPEGNAWDVRLAPADPPAVVEVGVDPKVSESLALMRRPELAQQKVALANRELDEVLTGDALLPRLDFTVTYGRTSLGEGYGRGVGFLDDPAYDNYSLALELKTPLLNRAEQARHRRARLATTQAAWNIEDLKRRIVSEVRQDAVEVQSQWQRIHATEQAVEGRREELRVEEERYSVGTATNLDVLQVQRFLIQARVDAVTARVNYIKALTQLYASEGTLLARRGVDVLDTGGEATAP